MARLPVLRGNSCGKIPEHRRAASRPPQVRTQRALAETERIPQLSGPIDHAAAFHVCGAGGRSGISPPLGPPLSRHAGGGNPQYCA